MHKSFYASGFLYHSSSKKILLQQQTKGDETMFVFFRGKSRNGNDPKSVFQQCIEKALGSSITASCIHPVYDYIHSSLGEHYIFFVNVADDACGAFASKCNTAWLELSKLSKSNMSEQTRHDIVVGERVIRWLTESVQGPREAAPNVNPQM